MIRERTGLASGGMAVLLGGAILLAGVAVLSLLFVTRNEEHRALDDAARREAPGRFIGLSDGMVHYERAGPDTGDPVVLVHGFSVPSYIWDTTFATLSSAGYRVVRYDLFGRGYSDRPRADYNAALFIRQLDELLDTLRLQTPVHLVGLSMGGLVVANFALAHPGRVRTVTLVDPAYSPRISLAVALGVPLLGEYLFVMAARGLPESQLGDFLHPERHPAWPERYRAQMRFEGFRRAILSTLRQNVRRDDAELYAKFGQLGLPTLLVWGRQDQTVRFEYSDSIRIRVPGITVVPIDSAGHLPHIEQPLLTHAALLAFLGRRRSGGAP